MTNVEKGAALHRAMLEEMPSKQFYVKVDLDCAISPSRLLHFLSFLDRRVGTRGSAVHFGTSRLATSHGEVTHTWSFDVDPTRHALLRSLDALPAGSWRLQTVFRQKMQAAGLAQKVVLPLTQEEKVPRVCALVRFFMLTRLQRSLLLYSSVRNYVRWCCVAAAAPSASLRAAPRARPGRSPR